MPRHLTPQSWLWLRLFVTLLRGTMPSIRKSSWQQCFNLVNSQYLVYAYIHSLCYRFTFCIITLWTNLSFLWLARAGHQCIKQEEEVLGRQKQDKRGRPEGSILQTRGSGTQWCRKTQQGTTDLCLLWEASSGRDAEDKCKVNIWGLYSIACIM